MHGTAAASGGAHSSTTFYRRSIGWIVEGFHVSHGIVLYNLEYVGPAGRCRPRVWPGSPSPSPPLLQLGCVRMSLSRGIIPLCHAAGRCRVYLLYDLRAPAPPIRPHVAVSTSFIRRENECLGERTCIVDRVLDRSIPH